jgi:hypothetical protein
LSLWLATAIRGMTLSPNTAHVLLAGGEAGAVMGTVLAPVAAWSLMRSVPLWRAIAEPALGTVLGALAGALLGPLWRPGLAWSIVGVLIGFLVAAVHLCIVFGARSSRAKSVAVAAS